MHADLFEKFRAVEHFSNHDFLGANSSDFQNAGRAQKNKDEAKREGKTYGWQEAAENPKFWPTVRNIPYVFFIMSETGALTVNSEKGRLELGRFAPAERRAYGT